MGWFSTLSAAALGAVDWAGLGWIPPEGGSLHRVSLLWWSWGQTQDLTHTPQALYHSAPPQPFLVLV